MDPAVAPRLSVALSGLRELLLDREWHPWDAALAAMLRWSDIKVKTADAKLREAITARLLDRRGEYVPAVPRIKRPPIDSREVRLLDWPDPEQKEAPPTDVPERGDLGPELK